MELDILERNILKAIELSSVFSISEIKYVYEEVKSFDKTIQVLNHAVSNMISLPDAVNMLHANDGISVEVSPGITVIINFLDVKRCKEQFSSAFKMYIKSEEYNSMVKALKRTGAF